MQAQNRTQTAGPRDLDIWTAQGELETKQVVAREHRSDRDARSIERFGPMPGEIYPDEAHFGSFS